MNLLAVSFHPGAVLSIVVFGLLWGWVIWRWSRKSEDPPGTLVFKVVLSTILTAASVCCIRFIHPIIGVPLGAACAIVMSCLWGRNIGSALAAPLASLYDGGSVQSDPRPLYAIAEAHRKQARYAEAIAEIEQQLDAFPGDVEGLLMLAEIRARNLADWSGAEAAINQVAGNKGLPVGTRAKALQALADWHLDFAHDRDGARLFLQQIIDLFPDSPSATEAAQRLAHLGKGRVSQEPETLRIVPGDPHLGLRTTPLMPLPERDVEAEVEELRRQLVLHPLDSDARERLSLIYADAMGRLGLAVGEIEELLAQPNHSAKSRARWLHMLADLHIRRAGDEASARLALSRIIAEQPNSALAANAQSRLDHLKLELRALKKTPFVGSRMPGMG